MPWLNPGVVAGSPFLSDDFQITKQVQVVSDLGRVETTREHRAGFGIVTQAGAGDLARYPEFQNADNVISVITESELRGPTPGAQPDIITWAGTSYLVKKVLPYPRYGQGWYKVLATSQNAIDLMPEALDAE